MTVEATSSGALHSLVHDLERRTREFILTGGDTLSHAMSPDGQKFSCTVNRDGGYGIDLISLADGRRLGRIVQPGVDYQTDLGWSADGKLISSKKEFTAETLLPKPGVLEGVTGE